MSALAGTRCVPFEGAHNFRDLGGYPSRLGGEVRWGLVYRAGRLDDMTAIDVDELRRLGIRTVFDLRRDEERERAPDPVESVHVCLLSRVAEHRPLPRGGALVEHDHGVQFMRELYSGLLVHAGPELGRVLAGLAAPDALPAVFHCTAGKDRTGVVAALLLTWLGVDRETVLDDFELTSQFVHQEHHEEMFRRMLDRGMGPEAAAGMLIASRASMAGMLHELDAVYGGIESYLRGPARLDVTVLTTLRQRLLS